MPKIYNDYTINDRLFIDFMYDGVKVYNREDAVLSDEEKEIATQLLNDGWYGSYDDFIKCVRGLAK